MDLTSLSVTVGAIDVGGVDCGAAVLVDVREQDEWDAGHAPDAVHVPLGVIEGWWSPAEGSRPLAVVCRSGARSAKASGVLVALGVQVLNVEGGMRAWLAAGRTIVSTDGSEGVVR